MNEHLKKYDSKNDLFEVPEDVSKIVPNIEIEEEKEESKVPSRSVSKETTKRKRYRRRSLEKPITSCQHTNRKQYAKGMCNPCYYAFGKNQSLTATNCAHSDRVAYALGKCCSCYQRTKLIEKRNKKTNTKKEEDMMNLFGDNVDLLNSSLFDLMKERDNNIQYKKKK